jgi:hypothetical protein
MNGFGRRWRWSVSRYYSGIPWRKWEPRKYTSQHNRYFVWHSNRVLLNTSLLFCPLYGPCLCLECLLGKSNTSFPWLSFEPGTFGWRFTRKCLIESILPRTSTWLVNPVPHSACWLLDWIKLSETKQHSQGNNAVKTSRSLLNCYDCSHSISKNFSRKYWGVCH